MVSKNDHVKFVLPLGNIFYRHHKVEVFRNTAKVGCSEFEILLHYNFFKLYAEMPRLEAIFVLSGFCAFLVQNHLRILKIKVSHVFFKYILDKIYIFSNICIFKVKNKHIIFFTNIEFSTYVFAFNLSIKIDSSMKYIFIFLISYNSKVFIK